VRPVGSLPWLDNAALAPTATSSLPASFHDSVVGVGELQSVPGVVELRCAGRLGPARRECSERVCESLDGPMGDGIREAERAE
jgi:hypothetical protein